MTSLSYILAPAPILHYIIDSKLKEVLGLQGTGARLVLVESRGSFLKSYNLFPYLLGVGVVRREPEIGLQVVDRF